MQRVTIFGREGCGFCVRAKQLCEIKDLDHRYIDIHKEGISKEDLEKLSVNQSQLFLRSSTERSTSEALPSFLH